MELTNRKTARSQAGFTLIEIAVVLVIIGLLLGGVLQGQQLIENSRIKSATNDFNGIAAAAFSYQDRYGRLPGDDPGAVAARGASWSTNITAGDGDGAISITDLDSTFTPVAGDENAYFFQHLRAAGFIQGDPTDTLVAALPQNPFGGLTSVIGSSDIAQGMSGTKVCMSNVSGSAAIALDTQLDDGVIDAGRMRGTVNTGTVVHESPGAAATTTAYSEDDGYTICYRI